MALRPESMVAHLRRGDAYRRQGRDAAAARDLNEAVRLSPPTSTAALLALGAFDDARGDAAAAAADYARAVAIDNSDPAMLYRLALARYRTGAAATAIEPLHEALALREAFPEAHYLLAVALRDTGNLDAALSELQRAVHLSPTFIAAREELADLDARRGRAVDEMAQLQALAGLDGSAARTAAIALAQSRNGDPDGAIATLAAVPAAYAASPDVELALGRVYLAKAERRPDRDAVAAATDAVEKVLSTPDRRSEALALFGRALYLAGDADGALRLLREAVTTAPVDREAFGYLADACERAGRPEAARDALATLDALETDAAAAGAYTARLRRLGRLSLEAADPAAALRYLQQAADRDHRSAGTLALLADALWRTGEQDAARRMLTQAAAIKANDADVVRVKREVR